MQRHLHARRTQSFFCTDWPEQQQTFIPKMVSGQWTGTMNLTEPQAGSDLAAVRTRAELSKQEAKGESRREFR